MTKQEVGPSCCLFRLRTEGAFDLIPEPQLFHPNEEEMQGPDSSLQNIFKALLKFIKPLGSLALLESPERRWQEELSVLLCRRVGSRF